MKSFNNIQEWSSDMPGCVLPFFVWCASRKLSHDECLNKGIFNRLYQDFIDTMAVFPDTTEFREWCWEQYVHYYESEY
jgi:hypothetical protein